MRNGEINRHERTMSTKELARLSGIRKAGIKSIRSLHLCESSTPKSTSAWMKGHCTGDLLSLCILPQCLKA